MVRAAVAITALLVVPALALPLGPHGSGPSGDMHHHHARELTEIEAREPFLGAIIRGVAAIAKAAKGAKAAKTAKAASKAGDAANTASSANNQQKRELDEDELEMVARDLDTSVTELEAREPFLGAIIRGVAAIAKGAKGAKAAKAASKAGDAANTAASANNNSQQKRELDEDELEMIARDFDISELEARDPILGALAKGAARAARSVFRNSGSDAAATVVGAHANKRRELDEDDLEMIARDFDLSEIEERDPFLGALFKGAARVAKSVFKKSGTAADAASTVANAHSNNQRREFDEDELNLMARGWSDAEVGEIFVREFFDDGIELDARAPGFKDVMKKIGNGIKKNFVGREVQYDELD